MSVVCDYNYVFDPKVYLRRHFAEEPGDYAFLVDEAHNLVDRAREMFSADLDTREIQEVRRALKQAAPRCARALSKLSAAMRKLANPAVGRRPSPRSRATLPPNSTCLRKSNRGGRASREAKQRSRVAIQGSRGRSPSRAGGLAPAQHQPRIPGHAHAAAGRRPQGNRSLARAERARAFPREPAGAVLPAQRLRSAPRSFTTSVT